MYSKVFLYIKVFFYPEVLLYLNVFLYTVSKDSVDFFSDYRWRRCNLIKSENFLNQLGYISCNPKSFRNSSKLGMFLGMQLSSPHKIPPSRNVDVPQVFQGRSGRAVKVEMR